MIMLKIKRYDSSSSIYPHGYMSMYTHIYSRTRIHIHFILKFRLRKCSPVLTLFWKRWNVPRLNIILKLLVALILLNFVFESHNSTSERRLQNHLLCCFNRLILYLLFNTIVILTIIIISYVVFLSKITLSLHSSRFECSCPKLTVIKLGLLLVRRNVEICSSLILHFFWPKSHCVTSKVSLITFI